MIEAKASIIFHDEDVAVLIRFKLALQLRKLCVLCISVKRATFTMHGLPATRDDYYSYNPDVGHRCSIVA